QLRLELAQHGAALDERVQPMAQVLETTHVAALGFRYLLGPGRGLGAPDFAIDTSRIAAARGYHAAPGGSAVTTLDGHLQWLPEILGNAFAILLRGDADQPHDQKESHHRRHEVGVGDLPATSVVCRSGTLA